MPLTGLANAGIDRVAPERQAFAQGLARYAEADLACYRAEGPRELVARQDEQWDALLGWARRRFDVDFVTTSGLMHVVQPAATLERLSHAVAALDPFRLAGLSPLVTIGGSLVAALAVLEKAIAPERAWDAVSVDERWQLEQWGSDAEAEKALENRRRDFSAAAKFLELLD
jgi:chaperone required for assembly of F1-ATPase